MPSLLRCSLLLVLTLPLGVDARADNVGSQYDAEVSRGIAYLSNAQDEDGSWSSFAGTGITSLATTAVLQHGRTSNDPMVSKALAYLKSHVHADGGVYAEGSTHRNYETCLAAMCFAAANQEGRYDDLLAGCERFLKELQWDGGEGHDMSSMSYGGAGYGSHKRPDLSNTSFFIDALKTMGVGPEDEAMQRALVFVSRCQNLETEHNPSEFAAKVEDGGFYYTIAAGGSSQAGETPDGGLRSYGSMTYAGLKSMIFAGVDKDDPRVKAAVQWIGKHYTLDQNPGMGAQGLYYYYHTFAKALDAMGLETVGDGHDWRADLIRQLASTQREDGAWVNSNERWLESDPNLVTAYCLMALSHARPQ